MAQRISDTQIAVNPTPSPANASLRKAMVEDPGFGRYFTDHMAVARWNTAAGWRDIEICPFTDLRVSPAAMVFHYAQAIFEGLKAYAQPSGGVAFFRPRENAERFNRSAARMAMPRVPVELFLDMCSELVRLDRDWVPTGPGHSLYLRPFMFASEPHLGVRPADEYLFVVIASPVAPFFSASVRPISVWASDRYVRASAGGTGEAKCAGNYSASLLARREAESAGCDEVIWLDAVERRWVEEMGGMNVFFVRPPTAGAPAEVFTPPLSGTILGGITRSSLLALAAHRGYRATEERITIDEVAEEVAAGRITEAFACGTAAVVAPIGTIKSTAGEWSLGNGDPGAVTMELRNALVSIQEGRSADPFGWRYDLKISRPSKLLATAVVALDLGDQGDRHRLHLTGYPGRVSAWLATP